LGGTGDADEPGVAVKRLKRVDFKGAVTAPGVGHLNGSHENWVVAQTSAVDVIQIDSPLVQVGDEKSPAVRHDIDVADAALADEAECCSVEARCVRTAKAACCSR
jgi:hypothetical protein